jgi:hypothetical protein
MQDNLNWETIRENPDGASSPSKRVEGRRHVSWGALILSLITLVTVVLALLAQVVMPAVIEWRKQSSGPPKRTPPSEIRGDK